MFIENFKSRIFQLLFLFSVFLILFCLVNILEHAAHCDEGTEKCNICHFILMLYTALVAFISLFVTSLLFTEFFISKNTLKAINYPSIIRGPPQFLFISI